MANKDVDTGVINSSATSLPTPAETNALAHEELRIASEWRQGNAATRKLATFLRDPAQTQRITGKADNRTNIIDQGSRITYAFPPDIVNTLFTHLESIRREGITSHFSERQGTPEAPISGLMLDYDIYITESDTQLQDRHVHRIACQVIRALRHDLIFPSSAAQRECETSLHVFTIVKNAPVPVFNDAGAGSNEADNVVKYKYGFHILVPGIRVSRGYKKYLLRVLRNDGMINRVLSELGVVGDPQDCLDLNSASVPVLFLGSCKRGGSPYILGPILEVTFEAAFMTDQTPEGSIKTSPAIDNANFYPMVRTIRAEDLEHQGYNLVAETSLCVEAQYASELRPLVLARECIYRPELASEIEDLGNRTQNGVIGEDEFLLSEHFLSTLAIHDPEARYLHQILDLLDTSYYTDRNKWRDVIFALANTSETYKPLAEWFSHKCPAKWVDGGRDNLDQIWENAIARRKSIANPITKRSIIRWAQICNPERFRQISEQNYFTVLAKYVYDYGGILEHYMVAKVLYAMLGNKFVVDIDEGYRGRYTYCWFEFVVPGQASCPGEIWKWRKEVEPDELHTYISENLVKVFSQVAQHIEEQRINAENEDQAKYYQKLGKTFQVTHRKIFNDTFKNGVIRQANYIFRRRGFVETLDLDPLLLGTGNGVLRLGPSCTLINHFHEHPVMKFTPVTFRPFNPSDPWTSLMLDAITDIIPETDFRDWLLFFAASSLAGGVKEGILLLWNGGGANGKTFFMRMIAKTLGKQYAKKLNIALLTSERESADKPNSAVMQLKGCRFGYVEETQKAEPLNSQRLKEVVNPGEISGRDLNKTQETFEVTANLMVGQNYDFVIDTTDHGTWRRLKHYHSKVRFCSNPDPNNPYEKKDDQRFVQEYINDPACQEAMLGILIHYYQRLQREYGGSIKNIPCLTLDHETETFRNSQDTINRYITETIVYSPGNGYSYPLANVAIKYIEWYNTNIVHKRHTIAGEIIQDLENSALQKYIKRAPNKILVLNDCRIFTPENRTLAEGETYLGIAAESTTTKSTAVSTDLPPQAVHKNWWNPCQRNNLIPPRGHRDGITEDNEDLLLVDQDDADFAKLESKLGPKPMTHTPVGISDDDLDALLMLGGATDIFNYKEE